MDKIHAKILNFKSVKRGTKAWIHKHSTMRSDAWILILLVETFGGFYVISSTTTPRRQTGGDNDSRRKNTSQPSNSSQKRRADTNTDAAGHHTQSYHSKDLERLQAEIEYARKEVGRAPADKKAEATERYCKLKKAERDASEKGYYDGRILARPGDRWEQPRKVHRIATTGRTKRNDTKPDEPARPAGNTTRRETVRTERSNQTDRKDGHSTRDGDHQHSRKQTSVRTKRKDTGATNHAANVEPRPKPDGDKRNADPPIKVMPVDKERERKQKEKTYRTEPEEKKRSPPEKKQMDNRYVSELATAIQEAEKLHWEAPLDQQSQALTRLKELRRAQRQLDETGSFDKNVLRRDTLRRHESSRDEEAERLARIEESRQKLKDSGVPAFMFGGGKSSEVTEEKKPEERPQTDGSAAKNRSNNLDALLADDESVLETSTYQVRIRCMAQKIAAKKHLEELSNANITERREAEARLDTWQGVEDDLMAHLAEDNERPPRQFVISKRDPVTGKREVWRMRD